MVFHFRKRRRLHIPITLSVVLVSLDVLLMVFWIILLARQQLWGGLAIGTVGFSVILCGIAAYMIIAVKEIRLNQRQANFVDSVTHELKSPIASLRLYLETLKMRQIDETQRAHFYDVMEGETLRLDNLINQLLEVGRLDAIGQHGPGRRAARTAAPPLHKSASTITSGMRTRSFRSTSSRPSSTRGRWCSK